jgi:hypothetical protein
MRQEANALTWLIPIGAGAVEKESADLEAEANGGRT